MTPTFDQVVLDAAKTLPPVDRRRLVEALWDEAAPEEWPAPGPEWVAEVQRRSADFDAGRTSSTPWSEVKAAARKKAGLDG